MKTRAWMISVMTALSLAAALAAAEEDTTGPASQPSVPTSGPTSRPASVEAADTTVTGVLIVPDSTLVFRVEIGNRLYPDWKDVQRVRLEEPFHLGDTEFWAAPNRFLPDFRLGNEGAISISTDWNNPALSVVVFQNSAAVDTAWAFRNFPPHFSARSFFSFKLLEIVKPEPEQKER